jgi:riboflavin biosynthesis pyrimidine reductase
VLTNENNKTSTYQNVVYCASPDEAMRKAREKGCSEILLVGGARTNSSFLKESLIDEIFLTVHPLTFGAGISLFGGAEKQLSLKLLNQELLGEGLIQLHYKVEK